MRALPCGEMLVCPTCRERQAGEPGERGDRDIADRGVGTQVESLERANLPQAGHTRIAYGDDEVHVRGRRREAVGAVMRPGEGIRTTCSGRPAASVAPARPRAAAS